MTEAERLELSGLIAGLVADIAAGTITVSPAVAEWLSELYARLLPVTEAEFEQLMRAALAEKKPALDSGTPAHGRRRMPFITNRKEANMSLYRLAEERGYVVEEVEVAIEEGESRPGWLVVDLACGTFVSRAVDWTTADEVRAYIEEASA